MTFLLMLQDGISQAVLCRTRATEAADDVHGRLCGEVTKYPERVAVSRIYHSNAVAGGTIRQGQPREGQVQEAIGRGS